METAHAAEFETQKLKALQLNNEQLKRRLESKETSLAAAQQIARKAWEENAQLRAKHTKQVEELVAQLNEKFELQWNQLTQLLKATSGQTIPVPPGPAPEMAARLKVLEDTLKEQNRLLLREWDRSRTLQAEITDWKSKYTATQRESPQVSPPESEQIRELNNRVKQLEQLLESRDQSVRDLQAEVDKWKGMGSRSPSMMQRQQLNKLKANLAEKEKEAQALTKALCDLRRDLLAQAQQAVVAPSSAPSSPTAPRVRKVFVRKVKAKPEDNEQAVQMNKLMKELEESRRVIDGLQQELQKLESDNAALREQLSQREKQREPPEGQAEKDSSESSSLVELEVAQLRQIIAKQTDELDRTLEHLEVVKLNLGLKNRENTMLKARIDELQASSLKRTLGGTPIKSVRFSAQGDGDTEKHIKMSPSDRTISPPKFVRQARASSLRTTIKNTKSAQELSEELTRVKRILQQTLLENEKLKSAPGVVAHQDRQQLESELTRLKKELTAAELAAGERLAEYRIGNERALSKITAEYERLRKDYEKLLADHERILHKASESVLS